ncbi:hypothetical protein CDCA_CDCA11G3236 [Cyanidium caldarium]|uniref:Large ribosomal subunit protein uL10-like insertion domain-containing protein n=1 Tax=Cyanidium caldarium TaxID=2771 RepID=A0AAV9IYJ5_CYACA|nr:hypothetical protein CDCA_CDCA11G3236 [Cyanidium caldarium]
MPHAKRTRAVTIGKVPTKTRQDKAALIDRIRACFPPQYRHVVVLEYGNARNVTLQGLREALKALPDGGGRLFLGPTRVMQVALGRTAADAQFADAHCVGERLRGKAGLLFSNADAARLSQLLNEFNVPTYARAGDVASEDVLLPEHDVLADLPTSMAPQLRQLGLPVRARHDRLQLDVQDETAPIRVCTAGEVLRPEQCVLLKLLRRPLAQVRLRLLCHLDTRRGTFRELD